MTRRITVRSGPVPRKLTPPASAASSAGSDDDAIHDNVAGEINALTSVTPVAGDWVLIEDASDSNNKKKVNADNFLSSAGADPDEISIPAGAMTETDTGSAGATLSVTNTWFSVWLLNSSANGSCGGHVYIPGSWSTVDIDVAWTNASASSGDVDIRLIHDAFGDTDALSATAATSITPTAPSQHVAAVDTLISGLTVTGDEWLMVGVQRRPAETADTLSGDIGVMALVVKKAS